MTAQIRLRDESNTLRTIIGIKMRDAGGIMRNITRVRMRDASNILRTVFGALSVSANTPVSGTSGTSPVTSSTSTVTVTGGVAPYTYLWRAYLNDAPTYNPNGIAILTPTANSTAFRRTMAVPDVIDGSFECEVTDALGAVIVTNLVDVTLTRT